MKLTIGITDCGKKHINYENWILAAQNSDLTINIIRLGYKFNNLTDAEKCDGILLSGGEDIHPKFYGKPEYLEQCNLDFMDENRDEFEWKVCEYVFEKKIPILGICRGLQFVNVFLGGTLVPDVQNVGKNNHSMLNILDDRYHSVEFFAETKLRNIVKNNNGIINSAHHQVADKLANSLKINSLSDDGVPEGLEWIDKNAPHYLMLVQWHPERMTDLESPFSKNIRNDFLEVCQVH